MTSHIELAQSWEADGHAAYGREDWANAARCWTKAAEYFEQAEGRGNSPRAAVARMNASTAIRRRDGEFRD